MDHLFFHSSCQPEGDPKYMICGDCYRFTLISRRILRMEYDPKGRFEDRKTQTVWNRRIKGPEFTVRETEDRLEILSELYILRYQKGPFTPNSLTVEARNQHTHYGATWRFGQTLYGDPPRHHNLFGTTRTLDKADGACPLDFGLMDSSGHSLIDDSQSPTMEQNGMLSPRREGIQDLYYIACGHDYADTLREYYLLTGAPPMLPRYALGNWWCRWHKYTAEEYLELMDRFREEDIPLSVAVLDMDWHITDVPASCGRGWTGYTWNRRLFPDPQGFMEQLHQRELRTSLNLHPADGIQPCEEQYGAMAGRVGIDPQTEFPVVFDCLDTSFMQAYWDEVLHPLERMGVDFWWLDWQQGRTGSRPGIDPLSQLNHQMYIDNKRENRRGLLLSRYAGLGSHRYPLGFSGDTIASWDSLAFQPYFTATASNVGFTWWSHDIGGFKAGVRDRELYIRWLQFGMFSPILRLHCTKNAFCSKEPWSYDAQTEKIAGDLFRLRHRMIPYLYTLAWNCHTHLQSNLYPVYWNYPDREEAYLAANQYFLGSELMVCPITEKADSVTCTAGIRAWIPEGIWTDFETGKIYQGAKAEVLSRPIDHFAVLAKPGALVPMARSASEGAGNPKQMELYVFPGASNHFTLFEDEGDGFGYESGCAALTEIGLVWGGDCAELTIQASGDLSVLPEKRSWDIHLRGISHGKAWGIPEDQMSFDKENRTLTIHLEAAALDENIHISFSDIRVALQDHVEERLFRFLHGAQMEIEKKNVIWKLYKGSAGTESFLSGLMSLELPKRLADVLTELIVD